MTNTVAITVFGGIRAVVSAHTLEVGQLITDTMRYWVQNLPYVSAWAEHWWSHRVLAVGGARWTALLNMIRRAFPAVIHDP